MIQSSTMLLVTQAWILAVLFAAATQPPALPAGGSAVVPCDPEVLRRVEDRLMRLDRSLIRDFLLGFQGSCRGHAEYSQWSNELLFRVLERYPTAVLRVLCEEEGADVEYILDVAANPVLDPDLGQMVRRVSRVRACERVKGPLMAALRSAAEQPSEEPR